MPGKLILVRHGQSTWNVENLFTGWHDVDLSDQGRLEATQALGQDVGRDPFRRVDELRVTRLSAHHVADHAGFWLAL